MAMINGFSTRIGACAALFRADHAAKVAQIAAYNSLILYDRIRKLGYPHEYAAIMGVVSEDDAARMYVVGALKASIRRGTARDMADALGRYEDSQVGDRLVSVRGESSLCAEVRRINRLNGVKAGLGTTHRRNMGVVLGSLYVGYDEAVDATAPDVVVSRESYDAAAARIEDAVGAYIAEYVTRLSKTAKASIHKLVTSCCTLDEIARAQSGEAISMRNRLEYLHSNFPARDAITSRELGELLRRYAA